MKKVMVKAWEIAKDAVVKFGGKIKEYFAGSLKMAWAIVKTETGAIGNVGQVIRKEWTTSRGTNVVLEYKTERVEHFTNLLDEGETRKVNGLFITRLVINGEELDTWNTSRKPYVHMLSLGLVKYKGVKQVVEIEMPENISIEVFGPLRQQPKVQSLKRASLRCPHCGEFCYSDCQAN